MSLKVLLLLEKLEIQDDSYDCAPRDKAAVPLSDPEVNMQFMFYFYGTHIILFTESEGVSRRLYSVQILPHLPLLSASCLRKRHALPRQAL